MNVEKSGLTMCAFIIIFLYYFFSIDLLCSINDRPVGKGGIGWGYRNIQLVKQT